MANESVKNIPVSLWLKLKASAAARGAHYAPTLPTVRVASDAEANQRPTSSPPQNVPDVVTQMRKAVKHER